MHRATKAALISAFIFPGCGHFFLKSTLRGAVFSIFSAGCLYVLMTFVMGIANDISEKLVSGKMPFDISRIMAEISSQLYGSASEAPHLASLLLLGFWGVAIIDSFILARKLPEPIENSKK